MLLLGHSCPRSRVRGVGILALTFAAAAPQSVTIVRITHPSAHEIAHPSECTRDCSPIRVLRVGHDCAHPLVRRRALQEPAHANQSNEVNTGILLVG